MLLIKVYLAPSAIHGIGIFAQDDLLPHQKIWTYTYNFDKRFTDTEFHALPAEARSYMERYGFHEDDYYYLDGDHFKYINHSDTPNIIYRKTEPDMTGDLFTASPIKAGTELLCNYLDFDDGSCCTDFLRK